MLGQAGSGARDPGATQAEFAATLVDEWVRCGISHVVLAPGSRSTPMVLACAAAEGRGELEIHVRLDERSAGFFALGIASTIRKAVVVVTTSGTAAVELHPAVAEASQSQVPLIICTGDRPPELHDVGAPQTMPQDGIFGGLVRWSAAPGIARAAAAWSWRSLACRAVNEASFGPSGPGPVHLNLAFEEPLVATPGSLPPGRPEGVAWHIASHPARPGTHEEVVDQICSARRGVVVLGADGGDPPAAAEMANRLGWPLLADPRSGGRGPGSIAAADSILRSDVLRSELEPDLVVRLGRPWASKVVSSWLADLGPLSVVVDPWAQWHAPERSDARHVQADATALCSQVSHSLGERHGSGGAWLESWRAAQEGADRAIGEALEDQGGSEPAFVRGVWEHAGQEDVIVVASSMPVRDLEWFAPPRPGPPKVVANRGVNGIDGTVSTALGVAAARGGRTWLVLGDLAFLYDASALMGASAVAGTVEVVVLDNGGGGIFSFLPQASALPRESFDRLFGAPQDVDVLEVARAYGAEIAEASKVGDVVLAGGGYGGVRVWRMRSDRAENVSLHGTIFEHSAKAAESAYLARGGGIRP